MPGLKVTQSRVCVMDSTHLFPAQMRTSLLCHGLSQTECRPKVYPHNEQTLYHRSWAAQYPCPPSSPTGDRQGKWCVIELNYRLVAVFYEIN